jgi:O-antigen/teichoic acid export membrane protein
MTAETLEETGQVITSGSPRGAAVPASAARDLVTGTSALGTAVLLERGFGFLANLLAARLGGTSTFGAYSFAITTANNVSTYAAGGIASTAIRFSGRYGRGTPGYNTLAKALTIIALVSAALGALVLWAGAAPLARLLGKSTLTSLLQWTALSVAGMILLECCRGFLVGQRQIRGILLLSSTVGLGMVVLIPLLARVGPVLMIASQGTIATGAVLLCALWIRPWRRVAEVTATTGTVRLGPVLREVWSFGLVQLAGLISLNAAGWWLTSLLARADTSMTQMGFFAIASQLRNVVSLAPSLLTESSLSVMAQGEDEAARTPERVMTFCTWATTFAALALAGPAIAVLPWALPLLYGRSYSGATAAVAIALVTAIIHMGSGPTSARLSILSIRTSGMINTIWATVVALAAATFLVWHGDAAKAALIYLGAHVVSAALLWIHLRRRCSMPQGMGAMYVAGAVVTVLLAALSMLRDAHPQAARPISGLLLLVSAGGLIALTAIARRERWLPNASQFRRLFGACWSNRRGLNG